MRRYLSTRIRRTLLILSTFLIFITVVCGIFFIQLAQNVFQPYGCLGEEPYIPETIARMAGFQLPDSIRSLSAHSMAFQDCVVFVRFEMAHDDMNAFLTSTYVSKVDVITEFELSSFVDSLNREIDWTFDNNTRYLYGEGSDESGREFQKIVIDEVNPDTFRVYIVTFLL